MLTEDVIPAPVGAYGESKIKAEEYIKEHLEYSTTEKQVYILRPCMIHGPGNKGNLNLLYNVVKKESLGLLAILIIVVRLLQSITFVM